MTNIDKAIAAIDFLRDEDRAPMDRYEKATQALGGFVLTELLEDARDAIDFYGSRCNEILEPYAIESEADYDRVSTADAVELVKHLMRFASTARDAEIELVMQRLHFPNRRLTQDSNSTSIRSARICSRSRRWRPVRYSRSRLRGRYSI